MEIAKIDFRPLALALVRHTPRSSAQIRFYRLPTISHNLYPDDPALLTNQTTLGSLHRIPSMMSLKRSKPSSQPRIDATNAQPAKKTKKGTTASLPDDAWSRTVPYVDSETPLRAPARRLMMLLSSGTSRTVASRSCQRRSVTSSSSRRRTATTRTSRTSLLHPAVLVSPHT